ncbi:hypothetical protein ACJIZ3_009675 [Penstemon smallii]|uniref:Phosphatidylinositol-glycan biosynthesis class X protein n=1 Tax=Penstemon smallii TaxID=265156 RepID=A0ABD3TD66_9LAMI
MRILYEMLGRTIIPNTAATSMNVTLVLLKKLAAAIDDKMGNNSIRIHNSSDLVVNRCEIELFAMEKGCRSDVQMEVRPFKDHMYSIIRVVPVFFIISANSLQASNDGETSYIEKYIMKTYFEKYDSLMDSQFSNFIGNDIPLGLSKVLQDKNYAVPTVSVLKRNIVGEGSHRLLSSSVRIKMQPDLKSVLTANSCSLTVIEKLPLGVFADPFELQHLVHRGVFVDAAVFGDTNLELPSFRSNRSVVETHMSLSDDLEVNLNVPLHARYPPLGVGFSKVEFGQPDIFMCCGVDGKASKTSCLFMPVNCSSYGDKDSPVIWEIPCGNKEHAGVVSAVTFGCTIGAAFLIVLASICYSDRAVSSKLKHS